MTTTGTGTDKAIEVTSPATGRRLGEVPRHSRAETRAAFVAARRAQRSWAEVSVRRRRKVLLALHDLVLEHRDEIMDLIQDENGKSRLSAFEEVLDVVLTCRYYGYAGPRLLKEKRRRGPVPVFTRTREQYAPRGVVGIIAPFNYPFSLALSDALAALLAGNAVVLKPDSQTPLSALRGLELLREAGLPEGVLQVVTGAGAEVGQEIVAQCDYLMFTGSTATGEKLAQQASARLIGCSMELGGKNPMIVADDADLDRAVEGAWAACFSNSGQLCISIERIYVHRKVADEFTRRFVARVEQMRVGPGHDWETDMGSQISPEHTDKIAAFVDDAVAHGARVLTGGRRLRELGDAFYAPTVLADVPPAADLYSQEIFGPVVYIEVVDSLDAAVDRANDTEYGLNASVWAAPRTARGVAERLHAGTVNINEGYAPAWSALDAPMGGWKKSGLGRRHGAHGLLKYTEQRNVTQTRFINLLANRLPRQKYADAMAAALQAGRRFLR